MHAYPSIPLGAADWLIKYVIRACMAANEVDAIHLHCYEYSLYSGHGQLHVHWHQNNQVGLALALAVLERQAVEVELFDGGGGGGGWWPDTREPSRATHAGMAMQTNHVCFLGVAIWWRSLNSLSATSPAGALPAWV